MMERAGGPTVDVEEMMSQDEFHCSITPEDTVRVSVEADGGLTISLDISFLNETLAGLAAAHGVDYEKSPMAYWRPTVCLTAEDKTLLTTFLECAPASHDWPYEDPDELVPT